MTKLSIEGSFAVLRDAKGNIITRTANRRSEKDNWREILKKLTDGGQMPMTVIVDIAQGAAFTPRLEDGSTAEPMVPNTTTRLVAAQWLHEQMFGKAVAQTEIVKAEAETKVQAKVAALSDAELQAQVFAYLEAKAEAGAKAEAEREKENDDGTKT